MYRYVGPCYCYVGLSLDVIFSSQWSLITGFTVYSFIYKLVSYSWPYFGHPLQTSLICIEYMVHQLNVMRIPDVRIPWVCLWGPCDSR